MKTHVAQLSKRRLSDFFVKEDGHVAHKNALFAGTIATGAILASLMLAPDAQAEPRIKCPDENHTCNGRFEICCSKRISTHATEYWCTTGTC